MIIEVRNIRCGYGSDDILKDLNLQLPASGLCSIMGPNGTGKSTLLKALIGYLPLRSGDILVENKPLKQWSPLSLARKIALIPQELGTAFDQRVSDFVLTGRFPHLSLWQDYTRHDRELVRQTLERLGLHTLENAYIHEISGGEKQRALIARALVQETSAILLDESLSQLDISYQVEIMELLHQIAHRDGKLILLVSHNINLAANFSDELILMKDGRLHSQGTPGSVLQHTSIQEVFGIGLELIANPQTGKPNFVYPGYSQP